MSRTDHAGRPVDKRRSKALAILRQQRLRIVHSESSSDQLRPHTVTAWVRGHLGTYAIDFRGGTWACTCRDGAAGECAHAWATRLVTGWGGG